MATKKRGLGQGIDSLIPNKVNANKETETVKVNAGSEKNETDGIFVNINKVEPNREQPRKNFDEDSLVDLSESIKQVGVLQPLLVLDKKDYYEVLGFSKGCSDDEFPWCREGDPLDNKYFYTTHSELNAILNYRGGTLDGAKMYVTLFPCNECAKAIIQAGIKTVVYDSDKYADTASVIASKRMLNAAGVRYYRYEHTNREITIEL